ncbi:hypothetical protein HPB48_006309 [Haemaphysalis longicornis]|uniref:Uncharacterized protein n=1 Tax=Haemaphysalis longicornis TaxID=44386 RepID=A0A9J6FXF5_HAELO|nr:hypothetical protein HPB48_006309 [Haemaphysalis longicornis]
MNSRRTNTRTTTEQRDSRVAGNERGGVGREVNRLLCGDHQRKIGPSALSTSLSRVLAMHKRRALLSPQLLSSLTPAAPPPSMPRPPGPLLYRSSAHAHSAGEKIVFLFFFFFLSRA